MKKTLEETNAKLMAEVAELRISAAVTQAAEAMNFHDPRSAAILVADRLKYEPDLKQVTGRDGRPISDYLRYLVTRAPYLVKPVGTETAVSPEGKYNNAALFFGKGSSGAKAHALKRENPEEYARLRVIALEAKLI